MCFVCSDNSSNLAENVTLIDCCRLGFEYGDGGFGGFGGMDPMGGYGDMGGGFMGAGNETGNQNTPQGAGKRVRNSFHLDTLESRRNSLHPFM